MLIVREEIIDLPDRAKADDLKCRNHRDVLAVALHGRMEATLGYTPLCSDCVKTALLAMRTGAEKDHGHFPTCD